MTNGYLTIEEARDRLRQATKAILDLEVDYKRAIENAADTEALYRVEVAKAYNVHREGGSAVAESELRARADAAIYSRERDAGRDSVKLAGERLENARDSRRSLWRLIEWSMRASTPSPVRPAGAEQMSWP